MDESKLVEFRYLSDFLRALEIEPEQIKASERPDFILTIDGETAGVELTFAHHKTERFSALQIEDAQACYARDLRISVERGANEKDDGLIIGVGFEDGIPVTAEDKAALPAVAAVVLEYAKTLPNPGAVTIWAEKWATIRTNTDTEHYSAVLPDFIQNLCLYRDGKHDIKVTGGRGGITPYFDDDVLLPILASKNKSLVEYQSCDQSWLVIMTSVSHMDIHNPPRERANVALASFATAFADIRVTKPIPSDFDKTFVFKWPSKVTLL